VTICFRILLNVSFNSFVSAGGARKSERYSFFSMIKLRITLRSPQGAAKAFHRSRKYSSLSFASTRARLFKKFLIILIAAIFASFTGMTIFLLLLLMVSTGGF
jgi:hypothetical protein